MLSNTQETSIIEGPAMETEAPRTTPILNVAWARFSELDTNALARAKSHMRMRRGIAIVGILATLFAILSQLFPQDSGLIGWGFRVFLILMPLIASGLAAFTKIYYSTGDWLTTRAGAEEILKEIYYFRTILQKSRSRRTYLEKRLAEIQRQVYRNLGGELVFKKYNGPIPSNYHPDDPNSDPGFADLTGDEYFRYRLEHQLAWHRKRIREYQRERVRLQIFIIAAGVLGAFLAAIGGTLSLWVALTASFTAALLGWQELRNIDVIIRNYSKVVLELMVLYDHWINLEPEERTTAQYYRMVRGTEEVLWAQNMEYIRSQQEALKEADLEEEAGLVNRVIKESVESEARMKEALHDSIMEFARETLGEIEEGVQETFQAALGSLAEEASSEIVQQELEAMGKVISEAAQTITERASSLTSSLQQIAQEFAHVDISRDTTKEELNAILARFPKTQDVKG
ncbi:MAG TPA: SLATT domain-containing protein [Anaerolineales bacterium]|nr:SLATT domain-containing protein [Anaerolineales bacterium]